MRPSRLPFPQPLDKAALGVMLVAALFTLLLLWGGDRTHAQVRYFTWQNRDIGADDRAFILAFNRLMDWSSVTQHLRIEPPLAGKASWSGRRFAYTLTQPIPYGQTFQLSLDEAVSVPQGKPMQAFQGQFRSRDRVLVYLGSGVEEGRLILYNLTLQQKTFLSPPNLRVFDFQPYPAGDRILFSASERGEQMSFDPQLYTVTTGLHFNAPDRPRRQPRPIGELSLILDNSDYQNLRFQLANDGSKIIVQRVNRLQPMESSLWLLDRNFQPRRLNQAAAGDFRIAPDNQHLIIAQGQGLAIVPLVPESKETAFDFLPQYGMVLDFSRDGRKVAVVKFNPNFSRSLYVVNIFGTHEELLTVNGSILAAQFDPRAEHLYVILTRIEGDETYREVPYLGLFDLKTKQLYKLKDFAPQQDLYLSLSPDGRTLAVDYAEGHSTPDTIDNSDLYGDTAPLEGSPDLLGELPTPDTGEAPPRSEQPQPQQHQIWLFPLELNQDKITVGMPEPLAPGLQARWLP
ncbi:hypothetical protein L5470_06705 [Synechococcus sp. PCC 6717]|jgi:hypothetical protein|uniref:hypothetical protein n=1 Tax=Parathermosynechococcus lividus TaxID=33070 RepID=UPI000C19D41E|nr:hypothetical protein [Thermostichus lividus]MCI3280668.1 hypothetical protein [Synechococcus sp. PCC 6717]